MTLTRALGRYARPTRRDLGPRCELCASPLGAPHSHVVEPEARRLLCACRPCALLFTDAAAAGGRYRTVPERVRVDPALELDDATWARLGVPVELAFFFYASPLSRWVTLYPGPAGATEAELDPGAFEGLAQRALVDAIEPDVEALLVRRPRGRPGECFLVPIDLCYELVGTVRRHWRGFDGGEDARREIDAFFARVRARSRPLERGGKR